MRTSKPIRVALIGYGGAFNMGKQHGDAMQSQGEFEVVAACDLDSRRTEQAAKDYPGIRTFNDLDDLLIWGEFDLGTVILPHNAHAPVALRLIKRRKHVVLEKPMCITVAEADAMIAAARKAGVTLSVYHNRRWDGDYLAIQDVVDRGVIGEVFHVEMFIGGYNHPGKWWRSDKKISGGAFHDWGAHFFYWLLRIMPDPIESVTGFYHRRVWHDVTIEDQVQAILRFKGGKYADVQQSYIARAGKPRWRILGTKGAIVEDWHEPFKVHGEFGGLPAVAEVRYQKTAYEKFYPNIADRILRGKKLEITPESARRVIAIIETAERSAKAGGKPMPLPRERK